MYLLFANETTFAILGTRLWPLSVDKQFIIKCIHSFKRYKNNSTYKDNMYMGIIIKDLK